MNASLPSPDPGIGPTSREERLASGAICVVAAIAYPLFWWAHAMVGGGDVDPLLPRLVVSAYAAWGAWNLLASPATAERVRRILSGLVYLITIHFFFLLAANDLAWEYIVGVLVVLLAMTAGALIGYRSRRELNTYLGVVAAGIAITSLVVDDPAVPIPLFVLAGGTAAIVSYFGLGAQFENREELRRSQRRYRTLLTGAPIFFWSTDTQGRITEAEGKGLERLGVAEDEVRRRPIAALLSDDPAVESAVEAALAGESASVLVERGETVLETWHGPMRGGDGSIVGTVGVATDVTDLHRMGRKLRQAQKMEAVGLLAGGIAHDFNNILTAVLGFSQLARSQAPEDGPLADSLDEIRAASERAASLVEQLLAFSRQQALSPREADLNELVRSMTPVLRPMIGEDLVVETDLGADVPRIEVDPTGIEQILLNLVVNARDACPDGGKLTIATRRATVDATGRFDPPRSGTYAVLEVVDDGSGMDAPTRERIFEPFFTTKPFGRGSGLGLATVYGIVEQTGGSIEVESEPGAGTAFKIWLPARAEGGRETAPSPAGESINPWP